MCELKTQGTFFIVEHSMGQQQKRATFAPNEENHPRIRQENTNAFLVLNLQTKLGQVEVK